MTENLNSGRVAESLIPVAAVALNTPLSTLSNITLLYIHTCLRLYSHFAHKGSLHNQISSSSYCPCFFDQVHNNKVLLQDTREYLCRSLLQVTCSCRLSKAKPLKDCFGVYTEVCVCVVVVVVVGCYYPSRCSSKRPRKFSVAPVRRHNKQLH